MKHLMFTLFALPLLWAQPQDENHIPYIETSAEADSLVVPDEIYLSIHLREIDERNKLSVEDLEKRLLQTLQELNIDIEKQLKLADLSSNIKSYFLRRKDIKKSKRYELKVYDATTAGRVLAALEEKNISNVRLTRTDYSKLEELKLHLLGEAVTKAKARANAMAKPLGQGVGEALSIWDDSQGFAGYRQMAMDNVMVAYAMDMEEVAQPEIQFKPQKIQVRVQVRFRLNK
jgi:uncharacterized protein YggE